MGMDDGLRLSPVSLPKVPWYNVTAVYPILTEWIEALDILSDPVQPFAALSPHNWKEPLISQIGLSHRRRRMTCPKCRHVVERTDIPHVIRKCQACGREMHIYEPAKDGKGIMVQKGDQFVMPHSWLKPSLHPLKGNMRPFRYGLAWFAEQILLEGILQKADKFHEEFASTEDRCLKVVKTSPLFEGLDIENPDHSAKIIDILKQNKDTVERWTFLQGLYLASVRHARDNKDMDRAIWAVACAERCRSMSVFKEHLEEVVWMGQSVRRVVDTLDIWEQHKTNSDEEFWQKTFAENSYVISQVFAVPVVFLRKKAYVGGMNLDSKQAKFVDYLYSQESSREAVLVEIKTPATKLLGSKYRGIYRPSSELNGAAVQVLDYRAELLGGLATIAKGTKHDISAFNPRCVLIAGNGRKELTDDVHRRSFELFRSNLKDVEVVTYDELFRKVELLARLFSLVRAKSGTA
jgi:hypothetical protein